MQDTSQRSLQQWRPDQVHKRKDTRLIKLLAGVGSFLGAMAALVAILQFTFGIQNLENLIIHPASAPAIPNLKPSYSGTSDCIDNCSEHLTMELRINSQDQQGNLKATAIYTSSEAQPANTACTGTITANGSITLQCYLNPTDSYLFQGTLYPDGHIEGIEAFPSRAHYDKYRDVLQPV